MEASEKGHVEVVKLLIEKGAEVNRTDKYGKNGSYACKQTRTRGGHADCLLKRVPKSTVPINSAERLLCLASKQGNVEVVKLLIEKGAEVNRTDEFGRTALMLASKEGRVEVMRLLIENGAEVPYGSSKDMDCLLKRVPKSTVPMNSANARCASRQGHVEMIKSTTSLLIMVAETPGLC